MRGHISRTCHPRTRTRIAFSTGHEMFRATSSLRVRAFLELVGKFAPRATIDPSGGPVKSAKLTRGRVAAAAAGPAAPAAAGRRGGGGGGLEPRHTGLLGAAHGGRLTAGGCWIGSEWGGEGVWSGCGVPSAERESRPAPWLDRAAASSSAGLPGAMAQNSYVMDVRVPEGARPGQSMLVAAPTGQQVQVEIPAYATPGTTIAVSVPGAGPPSGFAAADVRKLVRAG